MTSIRPNRTRPARSGSAPGNERHFSRWTLLKYCAAAFLCLTVAAVIGVGIVALTLPDTSALAAAERHPSVTLRAADGSLIATYGDLYGEYLTLADLPKALPEALIATEDRRFYSHFGIDLIGIARAMFVDLRARQLVQGGSTITQQLAKNVFLTPDRTALRKVQEALLAVQLERHFTKNQLLEIYLNRVYFGAGAYGVDAAARRYFGKSARRLNTYECALLAGLLKAPSKYSPAGNRARAAMRTAQVLDNMVDAGYLTQAQAADAAKQSPTLASVPVAQPGMRYFADWALDQANGYAGDIVVTTTLDPKMQAEAEASVAQVLDRDGGKAAATEAALIAMSPDGAIRAMVGGRDYLESQYNRTTQAARQPGSAFKPFVYLTALEHGMTPDDRFVDGPIRIGKWEPHDFEGRYLGEMSMADAVAESINTIAAQVGQKVGMKNVVATAKRLGITTDLAPEPSLALGTGEVTLIDLTAAYCAFASGGTGAWPYGISEIHSADGKLLFTRKGNGPGRVIEPQYVDEMNQLLTGVMTHGTGKAAQIGRPAAGKTGTTSDFRDALFVGYTPDLVTGVWVGNDDDTPMNHVTGGSLPAHVWHDFMLAALKNTPPRPLTSGEPPAVHGDTDATAAEVPPLADAGSSAVALSSTPVSAVIETERLDPPTTDTAASDATFDAVLQRAQTGGGEVAPAAADDR